VLRGKGLLRELIEGRMEGKRTRGSEEKSGRSDIVEILDAVNLSVGRTIKSD